MQNNIVYKHTVPDGRIYIGITSQKPEKRFGKNGEGYLDSWFYRCGIEKYGWENIKHEILFENLSRKEAEEKEHELIMKYSSWSPSKGFNDSLGVGYGKPLPIKALDLGMIFITTKKCSEYLKCPQYGIREGAQREREYYGHVFRYANEDNCKFDDLCIS